MKFSLLDIHFVAFQNVIDVEVFLLDPCDNKNASMFNQQNLIIC